MISFKILWSLDSISCVYDLLLYLMILYDLHIVLKSFMILYDLLWSYIRSYAYDLIWSYWLEGAWIVPEQSWDPRFFKVLRSSGTYIYILSIIVYWFILIDFFRQLHFRLLLMNPPLRHFPALCLGLAASHFPPSTSTIWWVTMCRSRPALCRPFWLGWFQLVPNTCQSYDNIIQESYNTYLYWHHIKVFLHVHPPIIHLSIFILCLQYPSLSQVSW